MTAEERRRELERLLGSAAFARSPKLAQLLKYLVETDADGVKEVLIAGAVYGRGETYDPAVDSLVRVEVSRLRAKLKAHYEGEGRDWAWRLEIERGSYAPAWRQVQPAVRPPQRWRRWVSWGAAVALLASVGVWGWQEWRVREEVSRAEALLPEGKDLFLQTARERASRPLASLLDAAARYERALEIRPGRAKIWEGLARTYWYAGDYDRRLLGRCESAARRALELDPNRAEAEFYLAHVGFFERGHIGEAYAGIVRAIRLSPDTDSFYRYAADWAAIAGKAPEGLELVEAGLKRRPASEVLKLARLGLLARMERWGDVEGGAGQLRPDRAVGRRLLAHALMEQGRLVESETEYGRCLELIVFDKPCLIGMGRVKARKGDSQGAAEIVDRLRRVPMHAASVAVVRAELGDVRGALEWLWRAEAEKDDALRYVVSGKGIAALAGEPEYKAIVGRVLSH